MDVFRARLEFPQLLQKVIELGHRTYTHKGLPVRRVIVEDAGSGAALIQTLRQGPHKIPVVSFTPQGEKTMRFNGHLNLFESGRVLFPQSAPWLEEYVSELLSFPEGRFDDQVDSTSQFLASLNIQGVTQYRITGAY
jgi:predicted phage terminase large subunit-like protein